MIEILLAGLLAVAAAFADSPVAVLFAIDAVVAAAASYDLHLRDEALPPATRVFGIGTFVALFVAQVSHPFTGTAAVYLAFRGMSQIGNVSASELFNGGGRPPPRRD